MALIPVINFSRPGIATVVGGTPASVGGDKFDNTGTELIVVSNTSGGPLTVTFVTPPTIDGLAVADLTSVIPNGQNWLIGPFPPTWYSQVGGADAGRVLFNYSTVTGVSVKVLRPIGIVVP